MVKVRNISDGPRGLYVVGKADPVMLDTGPDFVDLEVTEGELAAAKATGWFEFGGGKAAPDKTDKD